MRRPSAQVWVAHRAGQLVGDAVLLFRAGSHTARLYSLIVAPAARGLGLGHALMTRCERAARRQGCTRIALEVRPANRRALRLYRQSGYVISARLAAYYDDGSDALRLGKPLAP
jgi:ribosomal protein S18 acetylase RimI-like enzyme